MKTKSLLISSFISVALLLSIPLVLSTSAYSQDYEFVLEWGSQGTGDGQFNVPSAIDFDSDENAYVVDCGNHKIQKFAPVYISVTIDIKPGSYPNSINLGSNGNVLVAIFSTEDFDATTVDPLTVS